MAKRDHDKDQDLDPAGAHGGDTGKSSFKGDGPQAEKGDQRRDTPSTAARPAAARRERAASTASAPAPIATPRRSTGCVALHAQSRIAASVRTAWSLTARCS
jgi:hypothetical protein